MINYYCPTACGNVSNVRLAPAGHADRRWIVGTRCAVEVGTCRHLSAPVGKEVSWVRKEPGKCAIPDGSMVASSSKLTRAQTLGLMVEE